MFSLNAALKMAWLNYKERMHFYFVANKIIDDNEKLPMFLSSVSPTIFALLQNLFAPKELRDATTTFIAVVEALDKHFDEHSNILSSTYEFYLCLQKPGQTAAEWIATLRSKARLCGFSTSSLKDKPIDRALRDMLVLGTNDGKARSELLRAGDPSLEEAEKIIRTCEQLRQNISKFDKPSSSGSLATVKKIVKKSDDVRNRKATWTKGKGGTDKGPPRDKCKHCGYKNHASAECDFRDASCYACGERGHIASICRRPAQNRAGPRDVPKPYNKKGNQYQVEQFGPSVK